ncbi:endonuclease V [Streptomyces sp. NPDC050085]|uniref:endonuclease V n=1 Tax=Streptomyces sp. NPDC050085 TaxID=3365600 RepID=UPI0037988787
MQTITGIPEGWPTDEGAARAVQGALRGRAVLDETRPLPGSGHVTGIDVVYDDERDLVAAAAVVLDAATLDVVEEATAVGHVAFPCVPGLLAFREIPAVLGPVSKVASAVRRLARSPSLWSGDPQSTHQTPPGPPSGRTTPLSTQAPGALEALRTDPGLVVCDGYGLARPRRFGLASHLGVLTGLPTIGVAKNPFAFTHAAPGRERGSAAALLDGTEEAGRALRTRADVKPVYVSVGHRVSLAHACAHTLALTPAYRLPETTRRADRLCRDALLELSPNGLSARPRP